MNIFVAGLPYDLDDDELMEIFEKFGAVNSAKVAMDRETGQEQGLWICRYAKRSRSKGCN